MVILKMESLNLRLRAWNEQLKSSGQFNTLYTPISRQFLTASELKPGDSVSVI